MDHLLDIPDALRDAPVILASGSKWRKAGMEALGFRKVEGRPMPDDREQALNETLADPHRTFLDSNGTRLPMMIAREKVFYVLEDAGIPPDALVAALDTLPMTFPYSQDPTEGPWKARHLPRPKSDEDAERVVFETLAQVHEGYRGFEDMVDYLRHLPPEDREANRRRSAWGYLPALVIVMTGMAVRFPKGEAVESGWAKSKLRLRAAYRARDEGELRALARAVVAAMEASGTPSRTIAGGIDYANPRIIDILDIEEIRPEGDEALSDPGLYKGFPSLDFLEFLANPMKNIGRWAG